MRGNGEIIGQELEKNVAQQEKNEGKWRENAPNFRIIAVFLVAIVPFFPEGLTEIGASHYSLAENVASKYPEWRNGEQATCP